jgi:choline dehydrogenase-like flavoprotein
MAVAGRIGNHAHILGGSLASKPWPSRLPRQEGVGYLQFAIDNGVRDSTARAFLRPAMNRKNLVVQTRALAQNLILEGKRAVGVRYTVDGQTREARGKQIIVSGGHQFASTTHAVRHWASRAIAGAWY